MTIKTNKNRLYNIFINVKLIKSSNIWKLITDKGGAMRLLFNILPSVNEMDSSGFLRSHGQYFLADSCRLLLPIAIAIRLRK